ncbi:YqiJ family protein [Variovorax sp. J22P271]|uniref:YqiJ family protein n=1 Tax=Variovorax davisae TaxID=3053515 RepID=UPI0025767E74|nr:YqiJ family protein [Variovorax sp. J22P271]MDM0032567.1 YqiJ family protein [Variovorax sp. J22P271]
MILLTAPETWPFGAALGVMVGLSVLEGAGLLLAHSPSQWLEALLPESPEGVDGPLGWLHVGKVPLLVLLILFLAGFSISGYVIQVAALSMGGGLLPAWGASIPAACAGLSTVSALGALIARVMPGDETTAVSEQSLVGRVGLVVRGHARQGMAAEAKVRDAHGHVHYVMVEPDLPDQSFAEGADVLLVKKVGARFRCIGNPHPELL